MTSSATKKGLLKGAEIVYTIYVWGCACTKSMTHLHASSQISSMRCLMETE